jgi:hypothetical protein
MRLDTAHLERASARNFYNPPRGLLAVDARLRCRLDFVPLDVRPAHAGSH